MYEREMHNHLSGEKKARDTHERLVAEQLAHERDVRDRNHEHVNERFLREKEARDQSHDTHLDNMHQHLQRHSQLMEQQHRDPSRHPTPDCVSGGILRKTRGWHPLFFFERRPICERRDTPPGGGRAEPERAPDSKGEKPRMFSLQPAGAAGRDLARVNCQTSLGVPRPAEIGAPRMAASVGRVRDAPATQLALAPGGQNPWPFLALTDAVTL